MVGAVALCDVVSHINTALHNKAQQTRTPECNTTTQQHNNATAQQHSNTTPLHHVPSKHGEATHQNVDLLFPFPERELVWNSRGVTNRSNVLSLKRVASVLQGALRQSWLGHCSTPLPVCTPSPPHGLTETLGLGVGYGLQNWRCMKMNATNCKCTYMYISTYVIYIIIHAHTDEYKIPRK